MSSKYTVKQKIQTKLLLDNVLKKFAGQNC